MLTRRACFWPVCGPCPAVGERPAAAQARTEFKRGLVDLCRLDALGLCADAGIVKKWADKYGITIEVTQFNDYVESINQYTAGAYDAVTVTNMDALSIPAAGGVDTTAVIVGRFLGRQ
jgi:NitT/TauT family transport system substrate-binding protein